jgi:hypothetical protein
LNKHFTFSQFEDAEGGFVELEVLPVELKVRLLGLKRCFGDPEAVSGFCVCRLRDECLRTSLRNFLRLSEMLKTAKNKC